MALYRGILLALAAAAASQCVVSCARSNATPDDAVPVGDGSVATVTEPVSFKNDDLGGKRITFLTVNSHDTDYYDNYILADSTDGTAISKAVTERNQLTEHKYNVTIVTDEVYIPRYEVINRTQAGQVDFDAIYEWGTRLSTLALDGSLYNLNDLKTVDLSRSYWIPGVRNDLTISGKTYIATNYITMNSLRRAGFIIYNKSIYDSLGESASLYDLVDRGEWTFDKYVDLAISAGMDVDGNGIMTSADQYGVWGDITETLTSFAKSAGITNTEKQADGSYCLNVYDETVVDIYTSFRGRLKEASTFITYENIWSEMPDLSAYESRYVGARYLGFGEGHVLFMNATVDTVGEFSGMEDGFGILPNPVYSSDQSRYYHFVDSTAPMFAIPADGTSQIKTGTVLEYMAYQSENYVLPAFLDATVDSIGTGDPRDSKMLSIIRSSVKYDWTDIYCLTVTNSIMDKMMSSGSFKSVYKRFESKAKAEIDGCVDSLAFMGLN